MNESSDRRASHRPEFAQDFLNALRRNLADLKGIDGRLSGTINSFRQPERGEHAYRVHVALQGAFPALADVDVYFTHPQAAYIRCVPSQGEQSIYRLGVSVCGEAVAAVAVAPGETVPMSARQLAEDVVSSIVDRVRGLSHRIRELSRIDDYE